MDRAIREPLQGFLVKINDVYKRIWLDDIFCLESEGKYVSLILENRRYSYRGTLKELEQVLPDNFIRVHSSFIVNIEKISVVKNLENVVVLQNNLEVSYSRTFKENLFKHFLVG